VVAVSVTADVAADATASVMMTGTAAASIVAAAGEEAETSVVVTHVAVVRILRH
jgi:hypothetical protein